MGAKRSSETSLVVRRPKSGRLSATENKRRNTEHGNKYMSHRGAARRRGNPISLATTIRRGGARLGVKDRRSTKPPFGPATWASGEVARKWSGARNEPAQSACHPRCLINLDATRALLLKNIHMVFSTLRGGHQLLDWPRFMPFAR